MLSDSSFATTFATTPITTTNEYAGTSTTPSLPANVTVRGFTSSGSRPELTASKASSGYPPRGLLAGLRSFAKGG